MRKPNRIDWAVAAGLALITRNAGAQLDVVPTQPNVMLLVDNSGSMEWKSSGNVSPVCDPTNPNTATSTTNEKSRWIELQETLTGTIDNYSCYAQPRTVASGFRDEFELDLTHPPYDMGYIDSYHRPMSNLCAPGPGLLPPPSSPFQFPVGGVTYRPFQGNTVSLAPGSPCSFSQASDGLLDAWNGQIRFGLMTFDTHPDPGTGVRADGSADYGTGLAGTWSYYYPQAGVSCHHQTTLGSSAQCGGLTAGCCVGGPYDCTTPAAYEVGARNAAAPPWEGRMVGFGPSAEDGTVRNQWIQQILLATRPYGATPIAGMLSDARDFLWYDNSPDPLNPSPAKFGPSTDPLVTATCRQNYIVLLTDGEPNTDFRPYCQNGGVDKCPYDTPDSIANDLVTSTTNPQVRTFVVGFAIAQASVSGSGDAGTQNIDCATMDISQCNPLPTDPVLHACCVMNNIAYNGTPISLRGPPTKTPPEDHAFFPKNPTELRSSLSTIFQKLLTKSTGRTYPVTSAAAPGDSTGATGFEFSSGTLPLANGVWQGVLVRKRITCDATLNPIVNPANPTAGDDFIANVDSSPSTRTIFTVEPDPVLNTPVKQATWSIRPLLDSTVADGVGHYSGTQTSYDAATSFSSDVTPEAMNVTAATCGTGSAASCRTRILDWAVGLPSASPQTRCSSATCSVIGDIFHSVPQVRAGVPSDFLRDSTYENFSAGLAKRDTMLYTSSNDGFFHAFTITPGDTSTGNASRSPVTTLHNNEQWAFIPPAVLPEFVSMYSGTQNAILNRIPALDGVPMIKDVAVTQNGPRQISAAYPYRFERKMAPDATQGEVHTWRSIMVQAYGSGRGGYFALDITKPNIDSANLTTTGPKFLWQLSTDDLGNQMFGRGSNTPLVTTLYMKTGLTPEPNREVAVAVLPGGLGDPPTTATATCPSDAATAIPIFNGSSPNFRSLVRCYGPNGGSNNSISARSLTIVRLDTGEVIRTFRTATPTTLLQPVHFPASVVTNYTWDSSGSKTNLDISAPIVGQPVAYPSDTGSVADRIFVGDAEGRIWRVDVSNPDPTLWAMNVFFDPYTDAGANKNLGQPIQTTPVLSVDGSGQITLAFSTGDQDNFAPDPDQAHPTTFNYVASVTEVVDVASNGTRTFKSKLNWRQAFPGGERVVGPMTLFNKSLYYSSFFQGTSANCADIGTSTIWGVDYLNPASGGVFAGGNPVATFPQTQANTVIAGVGLRQLPSCSSGATLTSSSDQFLGYGSMTQTTTSNPGTFQLVFNKGGAVSSPGTVATQTINLAPPKTPVRIDSWAPIIE